MGLLPGLGIPSARGQAPIELKGMVVDGDTPARSGKRGVRVTAYLGLAKDAKELAPSTLSDMAGRYTIRIPAPREGEAILVRYEMTGHQLAAKSTVLNLEQTKRPLPDVECRQGANPDTLTAFSRMELEALFVRRREGLDPLEQLQRTFDDYQAFKEQGVDLGRKAVELDPKFKDFRRIPGLDGKRTDA